MPNVKKAKEDGGRDFLSCNLGVLGVLASWLSIHLIPPAKTLISCFLIDTRDAVRVVFE